MSEEVTTEEVVDTPTEETTHTTTETTTDDRAFTDTFIDAMTDEDLKSQKMWDNLKGKSADEFGKYVRELKAFSGKKGDIPKPEASEEEWSAFHQKLGRPESLDGYDWNLGDEFKEMVGEQAGFYEGAVDWFKDTAFKAGLSSNKAEELFNGYLDQVASQFTEIGKVRTEREEASALALKNEWGDKQEGIELGIKSLLKDKGGMTEEDVQEFESLGLMKEPKLAIALAKISAKFDDDPELGSFVAETAAGIQDQMSELTMQMKREYAEHGKYMPSTLSKLSKLQARL